MQYKTIVLELIRQRPRLHARLRRKRQLLAEVNRLAGDLKARHEELTTTLTKGRAAIDPVQAPGAAMEIGLKEVEHRLRLMSQARRPRVRKRTRRG